MTFEEILDQATAMLQRRGRLTYGTLKRQFQLDDAALEDLQNELIKGQRLARDEDGEVLVWTGAAGPPPAPPPTPPPRAATSHSARAAGVYPTLSGREDPHHQKCPGRRAQTGHRAVRRPQRLHGADPRSRPGSRPNPPRSGAATHDGRRAPL